MTDPKKLNAAEIQFRKTQRAEDSKKTKTGYESEAAAADKKIERLKMLRLERDAAEQAANPAGGAKEKPVKGKRGVKKKSGTLSQWLAQQKQGGWST